MSKNCKKCDKEIPKRSKKNLCESCQNKTNGIVRRIGEGGLGLVVAVGSIVLFVVTKGKIGGPKA